MGGGNVAVTHGLGLTHALVQDLLHPRGQLQHFGQFAALAGQLTDHILDLFGRHIGKGRHIVPGLAEQPQEQMLRAHILMLEFHRRLLGRVDHPLGFPVKKLAEYGHMSSLRI